MSFFEFPHTRTYDTDLGWLIKQTHTNEEAIAALEEWKTQTQPTIDDFKNMYDMIMGGDLPDGMKIGIAKWMEVNALDMVGQLVKMVLFGITEDGYFIAYIPESWDDIIFGTSGLDDFPLGIDFGHLTLSY